MNMDVHRESNRILESEMNNKIESLIRALEKAIERNADQFEWRGHAYNTKRLRMVFNAQRDEINFGG
jgi:hypothetical protein